MTTLLTVVLLLTLVVSASPRSSIATRRHQPWRAHAIWVPPARTGDAEIDARNFADRSKWTRVLVNRA